MCPFCPWPFNIVIGKYNVKTYFRNVFEIFWVVLWKGLIQEKYRKQEKAIFNEMSSSQDI